MQKPKGRGYQLGRALKNARLAAQLSQASVAERLSKPQSFVSKYEQGQKQLDVVEFLDIVKAIGADWIEVLADAGLVGGRRRHASK